MSELSLSTATTSRKRKRADSDSESDNEEEIELWKSFFTPAEVFKPKISLQTQGQASASQSTRSHSVPDSAREQERQRWIAYFKPDPAIVRDTPVPTQNAPSSSISPSSTTTAQKDDHAAASSATTVTPLPEVLNINVARPIAPHAIIQQLEKLNELYDSRGPDSDPDKLAPIQWPRPRTTRGEPIVRYCICMSKAVPAERSRAVCFDPACTVVYGWHHDRCLSEADKSFRQTHDAWVCGPCISRRQFLGFPELESDNVHHDRHQWLKWTVGRWYKSVGGPRENGNGLSEHEKLQAIRIDQRLRDCGKWFL
ncbi:uncharacterized protein AB675_2509 [Cyphellophora attinorum]|uniref:Zinc finger PHD-type domain-containing protein n=1 Tax=Cyphellophora attinorum TaxID=1664694 RepID=A0A0N1HG66_9EURO|nr:uncharacterized protein AB675_2509 [Phialophora attinorum]KPI45076.1 hypothetical protein AB675_2509 [Phialophora attinorum]